jgi:hypothetical protein
MSNSDPAEKIIALIHALKIRAKAGDVDAVEILRKTGWHAAAALHSLAFWEGEDARATVREVAEKSLSWPINYHAMKDARKEFDDPETQCDQVNLGGKTGWKLGATGRKLEPDTPTGWAFYVFGRMEKDGIKVSTENAISYIASNPDIQIAPEAIWRRADKKKSSLKSSLRDYFDAALSSLR